MTDADVPLLRTWLEREHVRRWWGDPTAELAEIEADRGTRNFRAFIVHEGETPFGYLQVIAKNDEAGLDLLIGEPGFLRCGYGARMVDKAATALFEEGFARVTLDPNERNEAAIEAFASAGFRIVPPQDGRREPHLLMVREAKVAKVA